MAVRTGNPLAVLVFCLGMVAAGFPAAATARAETAEIAQPPRTVIEMADWAVRVGDNQGLPFAVVDKNAAVVAVFDARGRLLGVDAALVGLASGDDSAPGIGDRRLSAVAPDERTTPAGRFVGGYGPADGGRQVLWVDFATAVSLHPVVTTNPKEMRLERLKSPTANDNRITYGCINVSEAFYEEVVRPTFGDSNGVFYVLPDTRTLAEVFPAFGAQPVVTVNPRRPEPRRLFGWW